MADFREERAQIGELLEATVRRHLADAEVPPVNDTFEWVFGDQAVGKYPSTREMRFFLEDLAAFTPELANRLRERVLSLFPSWSVVPQFVEKTFTVYADGVRFGRRKVKEAVTEATPDYRAWLADARRYDEAIKGEARRHFRIVVPRVPAALAAARQRGAVALAAFAAEREEYDSVVWVLAQGGQEEPDLSPGEAVTSRPVTAAGAVLPEFCGRYWPRTDEPTPFFLLAHAVRWRDRGRLALRRAGAAAVALEVGERAT